MTTNNPDRAPARIALLHHTGGGNLGDDAIVESIISNIRHRWPEATIAAISMNPEDTERRHGIASYPIRRHTWALGYKPAVPEANSTSGRSLLHWIRATGSPLIRLPRAVLSELAFLVGSGRRIKTFDVIILCGGGQLTDRSGPWGFPYAIFTWFLLAKSARLKCVVLNAGAGPLINPLSKFFITRALLAADYVSFRDEESQVLARKIGFTGPSHVFPDNVYGLAISALHAGGPKRRDQRLVGLAPMNYPVDPPFDANKDKIIYQELVARFATFASLLSRSSYRLAVFGTDIGSDPAAIQDLRTKLEADYHICTPLYEPIQSLENVLLRVSTFDYVVTCRFHGVVFAHLLNKPVLAIAHHPKVTNLMNALGLSKYCVDIRTFDARSLADTFECLVNDRDEVKSHMASTLKNYKSRLKVQFDKLWPAIVADSVSAVEAR
jgi:polysaccharide pyruvyl transferase WcaK-like protein